MATRKPLVMVSGQLSELPAGDTLPLTWDFLVMNWSTAPAVVGTVATGDVYAYTLGGVTRYRLVPSVYSAAQDAFYSSFSGGVLSGLICTRG